jgi:hypothetical protein
MRRRKNRRTFLMTAIVAAIIATSAYAYTNTIGGVTPPPVGSGSGAIAGYTASNIDYNLSGLNIASIEFDLAGSSAASVVQVQAVNAGSWYSCDASAAPAIVCATTGLTALAANNLTIVAKG